jgi:predicted nuclease of predicted toxin-antitoxin system
MSFRILADENVDHRVVHRLRHYGHDVEHIDFVPDLGKGTDDEAIAQYSLSSNRLLLSSDDDFLTDFSEEEYSGLLFIEDETLSAERVSDVVHAIAEVVDQENVEGVFYVSSEWLRD